MNRPALDDRAKEVLNSLIQIHIASGEPVGSETVCRTLPRSLSPATVRNIMADLERLGYLDHPHTSAGRVPTDEGYRAHVDALTGPRSLPARDAAAIEALLREADSSPAQLLETASQILSRLSRAVGFVLTPEISKTSFRHIDLVRLAPPKILVVMVSRTGILTSKVIEVEDEMSQDDLQACANYLNTRFTGMTLKEIRSRLLELLGEEKALYDSLLKRVVCVGREAFDLQGHEASLFIDGATNILGTPEFVEVGRMRALFKTLEEKRRLVQVLNACISGSGIRVIIGHENPEPDLCDTSLVTLGSVFGDESEWGLGVLGSTRMEYARIMAIVEHTARAVRRALEEVRP